MVSIAHEQTIICRSRGLLSANEKEGKHASNDKVIIIFFILFYLLLSPGGYITVWDVGNFLLHPPTESNSGEHQEEDQDANRDEIRKEPKVSQDHPTPHPMTFLPIFSEFFVLRVGFYDNNIINQSSLYKYSLSFRM